MDVDTNILDYINVLNQTQIDKEDLPEFWYRVVDKLEKYKGSLSFVSVLTERNSSRYYLVISYDIVDDFENVMFKDEFYLISDESELDNLMTALP